MARQIYAILAIAHISVANPLSLTIPQSILPPVGIPSSLALYSSDQSIKSSNSTLNISSPVVFCFDGTEAPALVPDQCMEALVNSDFSRLPPTEKLTFAPRSSSSQIGQIGLPRRYHSCRQARSQTRSW